MSSAVAPEQNPVVARVKEQARAIVADARSELSRCQATASSARIVLLNGALARMGLTLALFPIDTMKTRAQLRTAKSLPRPGQLLKVGWGEGAKRITLLRGAPAGMLAAAGAGALSFIVYSTLVKNETTVAAAAGAGAVPPQRPVLAGGAAALIAAELAAGAWAVPFEGLKTRVQAGVFGGVGAALKGAFRAGPFALYAGGGAHLVRELATRTLFFALAARSADWITEQTGKKPSDAVATAATAAVVGFATAPLDLVRTQLLAQRAGASKLYGNLPSAAWGILKNDGPLGAFRGVHLRVAHLALSAGLFAIAYQTTEKTLSAKKWLWYADKAADTQK